MKPSTSSRRRIAREKSSAWRRRCGAAGFAGDPLGFLLSTPCVLAVINQEDLSGETEQQNLPGSTWQYPNWRRKMKVAVEDIASAGGEIRRRRDAAAPGQLLSCNRHLQLILTSLFTAFSTIFW